MRPHVRATFDRGWRSHAAGRVVTRCGHEAPLQIVTDVNSQARQTAEKPGRLSYNGKIWDKIKPLALKRMRENSCMSYKKEVGE